ncbi:hypothetical protein BC828DRAFT_393802 [Blastocladiella britannica]|nr:hypothetical protein BC828DRAFT_393802 [Blastocladiella britannica]
MLLPPAPPPPLLLLPLPELVSGAHCTSSRSRAPAAPEMAVSVWNPLRARLPLAASTDSAGAALRTASSATAESGIVTEGFSSTCLPPIARAARSMSDECSSETVWSTPS